MFIAVVIIIPATRSLFSKRWARAGCNLPPLMVHDKQGNYSIFDACKASENWVEADDNIDGRNKDKNSWLDECL